MKAVFLLISLALFSGSAQALFMHRSTVLEVSPDGKSFAASFGPNLNVGKISGGEKKFVKSIAFGDSFNWSFIGFTQDSKRLAVAFRKERVLRYYSLDGIFLGETAGLGPLAVSRSFRWAADHDEDSNRTSAGALSGSGFSPKYSLPADVADAAFSPDDKLAAVSVYRPQTKEVRGSGYLTLLSLKSGKYVKKYVPQQLSRISDIAFSPDSAHLAFADGDGKIQLVRLSDWKFLGSFFKHGNTVCALGFSSDGSMLAVGYSGGLRVYSVPGGAVLLKKDFDGYAATDWNINDLAFARDGSFLAALVWTKAADGGKGGYSVKFVEIKR